MKRPVNHIRIAPGMRRSPPHHRLPCTFHRDFFLFGLGLALVVTLDGPTRQFVDKFSWSGFSRPNGRVVAATNSRCRTDLLAPRCLLSRVGRGDNSLVHRHLQNPLRREPDWIALGKMVSCLRQRQRSMMSFQKYPIGYKIHGGDSRGIIPTV